MKGLLGLLLIPLLSLAATDTLPPLPVVSFPVADSTTVVRDSGITSATPDSLKKDSLRAGKTEETGIKLAGDRGLGLSFTFMIPIVREFTRLRSRDENALEAQHMTQDATIRFDDNDITWPLGAAFAWRLNHAIGLRAEAVYFQASNRNKWTPNAGDTVVTSAHINSYSFKTIQVSLDVQFNIDSTFLTANGFERLYLALSGEAAPLILFSTERTALNQKIDSRGYGASATLYAGVERYMSENYSFCGELGYAFGSWGNFSDGNRAIRTSDVEKSGGPAAYRVSLRALKVRLGVFRWF